VYCDMYGVKCDRLDHADSVTYVVHTLLCQQEKGECDACSVPIALTTNLGAGGAKYRGERTQRLQAKGMKGAKVVSVNMHRVGGELC
jgi:hypothetical protein